MGASHLASSIIYGNICIYVAELKKLGMFRALVEILSHGKLGARFGISWMTKMIATEYSVVLLDAGFLS